LLQGLLRYFVNDLADCLGFIKRGKDYGDRAFVHSCFIVSGIRGIIQCRWNDLQDKGFEFRH